MAAIAVSAGADDTCKNCHDQRHTQIESNCIDCHGIVTLVGGKHGNVTHQDVHSGFDWENDNANETIPSGMNESCQVCHPGSTKARRICEDCHTAQGPGPFNLGHINLRSDIKSVTFKVYSHSTFPGAPKTIDVEAPVSSCYSFDINSSAGTCHGVSYRNRSAAGGYFAFYRTEGPDQKNSPYHWTYTVDNMPESGKCLFCHRQSDPVVRSAWGNPPELGTSHSNVTTNEECWDCHVEGGSKPASIHSAELKRIQGNIPESTPGTKKEADNSWLIIAGLVIAAGIAVIIIYKKLMKK